MGGPMAQAVGDPRKQEGSRKKVRDNRLLEIEYARKP
jgi:hypothetical protein